MSVVTVESHQISLFTGIELKANIRQKHRNIAIETRPQKQKHQLD